MGVGDTGSLHHTCWVVNDLEAVARSLADSLSVRWNVWTVAPDDCTVYGEDVPYSFRLAVAGLGDSNFELIEPLEGHSVYVDHLVTKGEGFHHTCLIYATRESLHAARNTLAEQGRTMIQSGSLGDAGEFYYFHMPENDSALEVLYLEALPPPEMTIG